MKGLGLERDGELIAGVVYEGYNGTNVFVHVAAVPGKRWLNRDFLAYAFHYPFNELKVKRISAYIMANNLESIRGSEHLGFQLEATLEGAGQDGVDVLIYKMKREDCRYVAQK